MFVSKDIDTLTDAAKVRDRAHALAQALGGEARHSGAPRVNTQELALAPLRSAVVVFVDSVGDEREIDVLARLHGVDAERALATAAQVIAPNGATAYYLHPVVLVESRIANCADLEKYRTPRGVRQAEVAILVLREFMADLARSRKREARRCVKDVARLCVSEYGLRAFDDHGLDPWTAVEPCVPFLGGRFAERGYPAQTERIVSVRSVRAARRT